MTRAFLLLGRRFRSRPFAVVGSVVCLGLSFLLAGVLFAFVDGSLLRPLPFDPHDRLLVVDYTRQGLVLPDLAYAPHRLADRLALRDRLAASPLISGAVQAGGSVYFDRDQAAAEGLIVTGVDAAFFPLLNLVPEVGRVFEASDALSPSVQDRESAVPLPVLISSDLARRSGRSQLLGRTELAGRIVDVVGVLPPRTKFPGETNVWAPVPADRERVARYVRLQDGESAGNLAAQFPDLQFTLLRDSIRGTPDYAISCLLAATLALVLLAWVQVTSMVGVDAGKDEREAVTKVFLGAGWRQVATPWILEHAVIALAAVCLATPFVWPVAAVLEAFLPAQWADGQYLAPDGRTVVFLMVLSSTGVLLSSLGAGRRARRVAGMPSGGGMHDGVQQRRATARILGIQFGVTAFLLYLLGLAASSYISLTRTDVGFDMNRTVVFSPPPWAGLESDMVRLREAFERHNERLRRSVHTLNTMPEVIRAAVLQAAPFDVGLDQQRLSIDQFDGRSLRDVSARINHVGAGFVEAIGATVVVGQDLDTPAAPGRDIALVNESLARILSPGTGGHSANLVPSVLGRELRTGPLRAEIVGVIRDFVGADMTRSADPQVFFLNRDDAGIAVAVRLREPTTASGARVRERLESASCPGWSECGPFALRVWAWQGESGWLS